MRKFGRANLRGVRRRVMFDRNFCQAPESRSSLPRSFQIHERHRDRHQHPNYKILAQQPIHRLLSHYREDGQRLQTFALCHAFDFGTPAGGNAQTINDNIADLVCALVFPQAPIDPDAAAGEGPGPRTNSLETITPSGADRLGMSLGTTPPQTYCESRSV